MPAQTHCPGSRTLHVDDSGALRTLDQTRLPFERREIALRSADDCERAIATMQVRGAPLIGAVGAWGLAFALADDDSDARLDSSLRRLLAARPTAVNLRWALERIRRRVAALPPGQRAPVARDEAAAKAEAAGVKVVMNRCPKIEYARLAGEIGWNGVNSRVISSKKPVMRRGFQSFGIRQR